MTKNIYSTEQIEYLKATQHGIAMTSEHSPFIDTQRKIINAQTYRFLQSVINKEINIKTQDWPLVEELAEELLRSSNFLNRYKVNKVIKQIEQLASSANAAQANLKQSLNDIDALSVLLKNKQQLRSLSIQDLMTARQTIAQAKLNNNKRRFLSAQLQNAARIHYIKLKSNQTFNANNPLHTKFEQSFNLQNTKISPRSKAQTKTQHPIELHISQPAPQKAASVSKWHIFGKKIKHSFSAAMNTIKEGLSDLWYYGKKWAVIGASVMGSVLLGKAIMNEIHYQDKFQHSSKETLAQKASSDKQSTPTKDFQEALKEQQQSQHLSASEKRLETLKKIEAKKLAQVQQQKAKAAKAATAATATATSLQRNKTQLSGDYYDTSLEIHLKSKEKVAALYHKIDSLAEKGLIKFANGTNTKRYAHAATMYKLIRPYSKENQAFQNLLNGGKEDLAYINDLVIKAGTKGQGVKADDNTITTSNFAQASSKLQMQHLHNLHQGR